MTAHIRTSLMAALVAVSVSTVSAAAAVPVWVNDADRNEDGQVTRAEYLQVTRDAFDVLDENGSGAIVEREQYGVDGASSWAVVGTLDANNNGAVTRAEYNLGMSVAFDGYDLNADGVLTGRELETVRTPRNARRDGGFGRLGRR